MGVRGVEHPSRRTRNVSEDATGWPRSALPAEFRSTEIDALRSQIRTCTRTNSPVRGRWREISCARKLLRFVLKPLITGVLGCQPFAIEENSSAKERFCGASNMRSYLETLTPEVPSARWCTVRSPHPHRLRISLFGAGLVPWSRSAPPSNPAYGFRPTPPERRRSKSVSGFR